MAATLGLTVYRWKRWKARILKPKRKSVRQVKKDLLESTVKHVTDRATLLEQVGLCVRQRAAFLNVPFLPIKLYNATNLRQLYKRAGIRYKNVRVRNAPALTSKAVLNRPRDMERLRREVRELLNQEYELLSVDECCYTWRGYQRLEWSPQFENLELYRRAGGQKQQCVACCGAVSVKGGKEIFAFRQRSFNGEQFLEYCKELHQHMGNRKYFLQLDNCRIHTTLSVK